MVAPFVTPADPDTRLSRQVVWLPPGEWLHFFDGRFFDGDCWQAIYGAHDEIPVFARAGAIVPLGPRVGWGGVDNPEALHVHVFPGADNSFELYEDDGETVRYREGQYTLTPFSQRWEETQLTFTVGPASGETELLPAERVYTLLFRGIASPEMVTILIDGYEEPAPAAYDEETRTLRLAPLALASGSTMTVTLKGAVLLARDDFRPATLKRMVGVFRLQTAAKAALARRAATLTDNPDLLGHFSVDLEKAQARALLEVSTGAGVHYVDHTGDKGHLILWNNHRLEAVTYHLAHTHRDKWRESERFQGEQGAVPRFWAVAPAETWPEAEWRLALSYGGLAEVTVSDHSPAKSER